MTETAKHNAPGVPEITPETSCWVITEGLIGTENQCLGVAEALGLRPVVKRIRLRSPWLQLTPWFRVANQFAISDEGDAIAPPWPDLVIASGRKSIPAALHIRKASAGRTIVVQLQDPKCPARLFDLVAVPQHDTLRGKNVIVTQGALNRITPDKLAVEAQKFSAQLEHLPHPRVAVLIGGNSRTHRMTPSHAGDLAEQLENLVRNEGAGLMITASRRTGEENAGILKTRLEGLENVAWWDGAGENPYFAYLGLADYIVVTNDSVSMLSEAASTGKPVYVAPLEGGSERFDRFHRALDKAGITRPLTGKLESWNYTPPDDMQRVCDAIREKLAQRRTG